MTQDGQLVFSEGGARGASVITANGVEFLDRADPPQPVIRRSVDEPWRPATGFLIPKDGTWRQTSKPVAIEGPGLAVVLRSSDVLVPSWGGEVLVRLDALAPEAAFPEHAPAARSPRRIAIVMDGHGPNTAPLVDVALDDLGERDRVAILDSHRAEVVMPLVPGTHRTLLRAAVDRVSQSASASRPGARDLAGALARAREMISARSLPAGLSAQILVVTDGVGLEQTGSAVDRERKRIEAAGVALTAVGSPDDLDPSSLGPLGDDVHAEPSFEERQDAIARTVPPPGDVVLAGVKISVASAPAPARIIEASDGEVSTSLDADHLFLGDFYAGEARTEVVRLAIPAWVPGEPYALRVSATYADEDGTTHAAAKTIRCLYSSDVEAIATARNGDVIAYASALAMVHRLERTFLGATANDWDGLRPLVARQAASMRLFGERQRDEALLGQAEILSTLLQALDD